MQLTCCLCVVCHLAHYLYTGHYKSQTNDMHKEPLPWQRFLFYNVKNKEVLSL